MIKKLFRSIPVVKKYVDILVNIDDYKDNSQVAATENIKARTFQPSIQKQFKISDEAFSLYTNFINCVLEVIVRNGLQISKHYQSKKGYTYYIQVDHIGFVNGNKVKYEITFRINNHANPTLNRGPKYTGSREMIMPVMKDIKLGKFDPAIYSAAMFHLNEVCQGIQEDKSEILVNENSYFN
jgi:hypothetical protein